MAYLIQTLTLDEIFSILPLIVLCIVCLFLSPDFRYLIWKGIAASGAFVLLVYVVRHVS